MNIAELFVRVRGDTDDFTRKMTGAQRSLVQFEGRSVGATAGIGRLRGAITTLTASQLAGLGPMTRFTSVLGSMALGGPVMVGVMAGLGALAFAYQQIVVKAREAAEENEKFLASLGRGGLAALEKMKLQEIAALQAQASLSTAGLMPKLSAADALAIPGRIETAMRELGKIQKDLRAADKGIAADLRTNQSNVDQAAEEMLRRGRTLMDMAEREIKAMDDALQRRFEGMFNIPMLREVFVEGGTGPTALERSLARQVQGLAPDWQSQGRSPTPLEIKVMEMKPVDRLAEIQQAGLAGLQSAILTGLSMLTQALMIGGGSQASHIGGALGGAFGGAFAGAKFGMAWGPVGAVLGTMAGSLLGGLFGGKRRRQEIRVATGLDEMARALERVNEQLHNVPSGYKIGPSRFDATNAVGPSGGVVVTGDVYVVANDPKQLGRELQRMRNRGGSNMLSIALAY